VLNLIIASIPETKGAYFLINWLELLIPWYHHYKKNLNNKVGLFWALFAIQSY
jgi:hypothetical protein